MLTLLRALFLSVCLLALGSLVHVNPSSASSEDLASASWEMEDRDERAGWTLYTQPVAGSEYPRYRLVSTSRQPLERVIEALQLKSRDDRYLGKFQARTVLETGDDYAVNHVQIDAPMIADRDTVLRLNWRLDSETGIYHVEWAPPAQALPPVADGTVRIASRGSWQATPRPDGGTDLIYLSHSELGDSVPAWLINRLMNDQIVNELLTLQDILARELPAVAASAGSSD